MVDIRVAVWSVDEDVLDPYYDRFRRSHRTIISAAGFAPPKQSIVICGDFFFAESPTIVAMGKVRSVQPASTARVRVAVDPFFMLNVPVAVEVLQDNLDHELSEALDEAMYRDHLFPSIFLPPRSEILLAALRRTSSEVSGYVDELLRDPIQLAPDDIRPREARDAITMANRFANLSKSARLRQLQGPIEGVETAFGITFDARHVEDNEDDLLAADLRRFDDRSTLTDITSSAIEIADNKMRLIVMNVNRKLLEQVSGVDLVYYDLVGDKAVTVQYKRMERSRLVSTDRTQPEWVYHRKSALQDQLRLMEAHSFSTSQPSTSDDWRLSSSPNFFKFTWPQRFVTDDKLLIPGMYVPDEYLRLGIIEGKFDTGPSGGFQITKSNIKHFTSETFVELVRRCWIGTRRTDRSGLVDYARAAAAEHQVILALRSRSAS